MGSEVWQGPNVVTVGPIMASKRDPFSSSLLCSATTAAELCKNFAFHQPSLCDFPGERRLSGAIVSPSFIVMSLLSCAGSHSGNSRALSEPTVEDNDNIYARGR